MGLSPISKSLILQGFIRKTRSVTAFKYTKVVNCAGHSSRLVFGRQATLAYSLN